MISSTNSIFCLEMLLFVDDDLVIYKTFLPTRIIIRDRSILSHFNSRTILLLIIKAPSGSKLKGKLSTKTFDRNPVGREGLR